MSIETLAHDIGRIARIDGDHTTAIPQLTLHRRSGKTDPMPCIYGLGLAVVAQGGKQVTVGEQVLDYGMGQSLLITADLPVVAHVTRADLAQPFMCMFLALDARALMQQAVEMDLPPVPREEAPRAISLNALDGSLLDAVIRLVRLLDEPALVATLGPIIQQEIMVRLLCGPHGPYLRQLVSVGSPSHQIAQAMAWLTQNYVHDVLMDELDFRHFTGMSPLQYQKHLRLQQARHLMLHQALDAGSTAARVGYESASQFSRDYSRLFGAPPQRDIKRMRHQPAEGVGASVF